MSKSPDAFETTTLDRVVEGNFLIAYLTQGFDEKPPKQRVRLPGN
ncbi:MAG: hypothetical protein CM15mV96_390 [uncultured marine virus]|nr:MAG: hypothetical protein CM15mV96_390 [uncultured marine virus]